MSRRSGSYPKGGKLGDVWSVSGVGVPDPDRGAGVGPADTDHLVRP